ncbi:MAG: hypothetical protein ABI036_11750, partial [Fibrobacteria bacterium]
MSGTAPLRHTVPFRLAFPIVAALAAIHPIPCFAAGNAASATASSTAPSAPERVPASPSLRIDTAVYDLGTGVLHYAFTFSNPTDSVLFLDCQASPRASLSGGALALKFDRKENKATDTFSHAANPDNPSDPADSAAPAMDANDYPPQRVGARQTFRGQRRLDRLLGDYRARPGFSSLQLRIAVYPESGIGEDSPYDLERQLHAVSKTVKVVRRGKVPPPPRVMKL